MTHTIAPQTTPRFHHDGWTPQVQAVFLDALTTTGSVREAARVCGKPPSSAYRLRAHTDGAAFKAGWTQALGVLMERVRETAIDRAYNGRIMPVLHEGMPIGEELVFNDRLLIALMRLYDAPAYHAERVRAAEVAMLPAAAAMTTAEVHARFEAAMEQVRLECAARDVVLAELAQGDGARRADDGERADDGDLGVSKESLKADDGRVPGVAKESPKATDEYDSARHESLLEAVIPANAGTHLRNSQEMGPRVRGDDGLSGDGSSGDGSSGDGSSGDGSSHDGSSDDGSSHDGSSHDGSSDDGSSDDGSSPTHPVPGVANESRKADDRHVPGVANQSRKMSPPVHDAGARSAVVKHKRTPPARPKRRRGKRVSRSRIDRRRSG